MPVSSLYTQCMCMNNLNYIHVYVYISPIYIYAYAYVYIFSYTHTYMDELTPSVARIKKSPSQTDWHTYTNQRGSAYILSCKDTCIHYHVKIHAFTKMHALWAVISTYIHMRA